MNNQLFQRLLTPFIKHNGSLETTHVVWFAFNEEDFVMGWWWTLTLLDILHMYYDKYDNLSFFMIVQLEYFSK